MSDSLISIKSLNLNIKGQDILKDITLDIMINSFNLVEGGNGAGKTSLIRCLLGLVSNFDGEIKYKDQLISQQLIAESFAYIPQKLNIEKDVPISVKEAIEIDCRLTNKHCDLNPVEHLKRIGGKSGLINKRLPELSGGELQKVLIARGLISEKEVLIMDEPNNSLDKEAQSLLNQLLVEEHKKGKTLIIISHSHHEEYLDGINDINHIHLNSGELINE